jgi:UDP-N-acetylmuramoyl-tripeptide--D-alanyl-D-alanine ligase
VARHCAARIPAATARPAVKTLLPGDPAPRRQAYANPGNRNNEIGLPLAVIDAPDDADFAIYEMGAGKPGDIAYLTAIAGRTWRWSTTSPPRTWSAWAACSASPRPRARSTRAAADGTAVVNADDAFAPYFARSHPRRRSGRRLLRFGLDASADVTARDIRLGRRPG